MKSVKLEDGTKVSVFQKADLTEKLGLSQDKVKVIMKYQKEFPELLQDHNDEFIIDARKLWVKLGEPQGEFRKWANRKIVKFYDENTDYSSFDKIVHREKGASVAKEYTLTVEIAKHVSMSENTSIGREIKNYFIIMEETIRQIDNWYMVREPQKQGYKELCEALNGNYKKTHHGKLASPFVYSNEADMINKALLGSRAKEIREILNYNDYQTREHLTTEINKAIYELQLVDSMLVTSGMSFQERKNIIELNCKKKYNHIELLTQDLMEDANVV